MDTATKEVFYDKLTFIYLEMPKFTKTESELETLFDKWLYAIRNLASLMDRPRALQEKVFQHLFEAAELAKFDPKDRYAYEESLKNYRDWYSVMETAERKGQAKGFEKGMAQGLAQGHAEGLAQGHAEGLAQGHAEGLAQGHAEGLAQGHAEGIHEAQLSMARKLKEKGLPVEDIAVITGLSAEELSNL